MPDTADIVIVGGGLMGATLAYHLCARFRVALLEADAFGSKATGRGFAWINATSKKTDENYHRLNAAGMAEYNELVGSFGAEEIGLQEGGSLFWANDLQGQHSLRTHATLLQGWNYPISLLNREELETLEPNVRFAVEVEGMFAPADRWIEPLRLMRLLHRRARSREADIREFCPVTGFTKSVTGGLSTVETPQGRIATRMVVIAAGIATPALLSLTGADVALAPVRQVPGLLVEPPPVPEGALPERLLYPPDEGGLHLRPVSGGGLLIGADDTDALLASQGVEIVPEASQTLYDRTRQFLPALPEAQAQTWGRVCVRPVPGDDRPIVGEIPGIKGLYVAVAHSGITLAPLLARLLAEEIRTGRIPEQLQPYRPIRFLS